MEENTGLPSETVAKHMDDNQGWSCDAQNSYLNVYFHGEGSTYKMKRKDSRAANIQMTELLQERNATHSAEP